MEQKLSLQELWRRGCEQASLTADDQKRFAAMARSRFHTFEMGMAHAKEKSDEVYTLGLINGLAKELRDSPGLKKLWQMMAISDSEHGLQVTLQLEQLEGTLH